MQTIIGSPPLKGQKRRNDYHIGSFKCKLEDQQGKKNLSNTCIMRRGCFIKTKFLDVSPRRLMLVFFMCIIFALYQIKFVIFNRSILIVQN